MTTTIDQRIIEQFQFEGDFMSAFPYGNGHINETYAVYFSRGEKPPIRYILQKINTQIFNADELMDNICLVTSFLREKIQINGGDPSRETLTVINTKDNLKFYKDSDGSCYRAYVFIENTITYQNIPDPDTYSEIARSFGYFQKLLSDFPAEKLHESIRNFHNTEARYNSFIEAVNHDIAGRVKSVQSLIDFVISRHSDCRVITDHIENGSIPLRVTHNDTKLNNILVDETTRKGLCVIDLDTVMPGSVLYDFGDSIRFGANTADEDEKDLSRVSLDINLFEAYVKGFLSATGEVLNNSELDYLAFSAKLLTFECGMRFLTDYLNGDTYFKIHYEDHNRDRAACQFKLVEDIENKLELMNQIVDKYR